MNVLENIGEKKRGKKRFTIQKKVCLIYLKPGENIISNLKC